MEGPGRSSDEDRTTAASAVVVVDSVTEDVLRVALNREESLNALDEEVYRTLWDRLIEVSRSDDVKAVVLAGNGRAFSAGADLKNHAASDRGPREAEEYAWLGQHVAHLLRTMPQPVVAAVQGYAVGGGAELALSCDYIVMGQTAQLFFPEVELGSIVTGGATQRLPELVGTARAKRLVLLGERVDGATAAEWGLVAEAVPDEDVASRAVEVASTLASRPRTSVQRAKQAIEGWPNKTTAEVLRAEVSALADCMRTTDWRTGVSSLGTGKTPGG